MIRFYGTSEKVRQNREIGSNPPSYTSGPIRLPEYVSLLRLPAYSPELNPAEGWFQEFRRTLSNRVFETVELLQEALTAVLEPYWRDPAQLRSLAGFSWWVEVIESFGHRCPCSVQLRSFECPLIGLGNNLDEHM